VTGARTTSSHDSKTERAERKPALRQGLGRFRSVERDRSLITVAALVCLRRIDEFPAHLHRAIGSGVTETELAAAITHLAFYAGFPAAISASAVANRTLRESPQQYEYSQVSPETLAPPRINRQKLATAFL
jgi:Carboxymuconolactone decarboxylase family